MPESHAWKCRNGHTMGQMERNASGIKMLLLYREAIDLEAEDPTQVDVIAVIEGYATDIRCSVCGNVHTWVPGEDTLKRLLEKARR